MTEGWYSICPLPQYIEYFQLGVVVVGYVLAVVKDVVETQVRRIGEVPPIKLIVAVASIDNAKRIVSGIVPDAVLIEPELEEGDGIDFFYYLTNHPCLSHVPVIKLGSRGSKGLIA